MEQLFKRYINNHAIRVDQTKAFGYKDQGARNRLGKFAVYRVLVDQATLIAHIRSDDVGFLFYEDRKTTAEWAAMFDQTEFDLPKVPSYSTLYTIYEWVMNYEPNFFLIPEPKRPSTEVPKVAPQPVDNPQEEIDAYNESVGRLSVEDKNNPYLSAEFNKTGLDLRMRRAKFVAYQKELAEISAHNDGINARNRLKMEKYESEKKAFDDQKKIYWGIAKYVEFVVKERLRLSRGDGILENSLPTITDFDIAESTRNQKLREQMEAKMGPKELSRTMVPAPLPTRPGEEPYVFVPRVEKPATYLPAPMPIESGCHKKIKICDEEVKMGDHHPPPPPDGKTKEPDSPPPKRKDSIIPPPPPGQKRPVIRLHEVKREARRLKPIEKIKTFSRGESPFAAKESGRNALLVAKRGLYARNFETMYATIGRITEKTKRCREIIYYWSQVVSLWLFMFKRDYMREMDIKVFEEKEDEFMYNLILNSISLLYEKPKDVPGYIAKTEEDRLPIDYVHILQNPMDEQDINDYLEWKGIENSALFVQTVFDMCFFDVPSDIHNNMYYDFIEESKLKKSEDSELSTFSNLSFFAGKYELRAMNYIRLNLEKLTDRYKDEDYFKTKDGDNMLSVFNESIQEIFETLHLPKTTEKHPQYFNMDGVESEQVYLAADI